MYIDKLKTIYNFDPSIEESLKDNKWSTWTNLLADIILNKNHNGIGKLFRYGDATQCGDIGDLTTRFSCYTKISDYKSDCIKMPVIMCFFNSTDKPNVINGKEYSGKLSERLHQVGYTGYFNHNLLLIYLDEKVEDVNNLLYEILVLYRDMLKYDEEKELLDDFYAIMEDCYNNNNFDINVYDKFIQLKILLRDLKSFANNIAKQRLEIINQDFNNHLDLYMYCQQILSKLELFKKNIKEDLLEHKKFINDYNIVTSDDNSNLFVEAISKFSDINVISGYDDEVTFIITSFLKTWSKADLKMLLKNGVSDIRTAIANSYADKFSGHNKALNLFVDIFFNKKYKLKLSQYIRFRLRNGSWEISGLNNFTDYGMPNPHMYFYDCFGDAKHNAIECFKQEDYDTGVAQVIAAAQSITVTDRAVMARFIKELLFNESNFTQKWLVDKNGVEHSIKELIETEYKDATNEPNFDDLSEKDVAKETL